MTKSPTSLLLLIIANLLPSNSHAYAKRAHESINVAVIQQKLTKTPLKEYFKLKLGYSDVGDVVNGTKIIRWFENAGAQEDMPPWRTPNHFLDPLTNQGFSGFLFGLIAHGKPTAEWAQSCGVSP
ncbi:MAG: hypothetical protein VB050_10560 [Geobacteraceae bacterium]|nr:hypothetical protein [Geobacteraceae bacterium]